MQKKDSRELEILVAKIQKQLAPDAEVIHDAKLQGLESKRPRQIDVLVKHRIGQYQMLIAIECKDYSRPVDVKGVEEFHGLLMDVKANKGVIVCPNGFTETAKTRASGLQIDLYSPVDTDPHKWQAKVTAPVVCDFRGTVMAFGILCDAPLPLQIRPRFWTDTQVFSRDGAELGFAGPAASRKWNEGKFPIEPGEHSGLPVFDTREVLIENGYGGRTPVTLTVSLDVKRQLFFGQMPIDRVSGFKDELSGAVIINAFATGIFDPDEVSRTWTPIDSEDQLPVTSMLVLRGLWEWPE